MSDKMFMILVSWSAFIGGFASLFGWHRLSSVVLVSGGGLCFLYALLGFPKWRQQ